MASVTPANYTSQSTIVTLAGFPVLPPVEWALVEGTQPYTGRIRVPTSQVEAIMAQAGKPVTLTIIPDLAREPIHFQNLWLLYPEAGDRPGATFIVVADRRIWWQRKRITRRYNMRRTIGVKRVANLQPLEIQPVLPDVQYWEWSLKDGRKWRPLDCLADLLGEAFDVERDMGIDHPTEARVLGRQVNQGSVESLVISGETADQAIDRALQRVPDLGIYLDDAGNVVLKQRSTGDDKVFVQQSGPPMARGGGWLAHVSRKHVMPKWIDVLFGMEIGVRFDLIESLVSSTPEDRYLEQVLQLTDWSHVINGVEYPEGSIVNLDAYLNSLEAPPGALGAGATLSATQWRAMLRQMMLPGVDYTAVIDQLKRDPNADWIARLEEMQRALRRKFRLPKRWVDRSLSINPWRVGTADPTVGARVPAMVWANYALIAGDRAIHKAMEAGADDGFYLVNVDGYPSGPGVVRLEPTFKGSPADLRVVDRDQGLIEVTLLGDVRKLYDTVIHGHISAVGMNLLDQEVARTLPGQPSRAYQIAFNATIEDSEPPTVTDDWKLAVILSLVPAAPNDGRQLFRVRIKPTDVADLLPPDQTIALEDAAGPPSEIFIGPHVERARVPWHDDHAELIDELFGASNNSNPGRAGVARVMAQLKNLVVNYDEAGAKSVNAASLNSIARAAAAREYSLHCDRFTGSRMVPINGKVQPAGWIASVVHRVDARGVCTTEYAFPRDLQLLDLISLLDDSSRAAIFQEVQPR